MAEPVEALEILREVWSAQGQGGADLDEALGHHGHGKSCKNMQNVGFDGTDEDIRAAWRGRLEREGKLNSGASLKDLVLGSAPGARSAPHAPDAPTAR